MKGPDCLISISECSPYRMIRMIQQKELSEEAIWYQMNHLEVTIGSHGLLFNLNEDEPTPVVEIGAMHQLMDLQNYVDCGFTLQQIQLSHTGLHTNEETGMTVGGYEFGFRTWIEPSLNGEVLVKRAGENMKISKTHANDKL